MSDLLSQLLTLFFALLGLGIIMSVLLGGSDGPKKFLGCLVWPFKALGKLAFLLVLFAIVAVVALQMMPQLLQRLGNPLADLEPPTEANPGSPAPIPSLADRYPALRQTDRAIYADDETYEEWNETACLPTVYLMLVRGGHNPDARLDASWFNDSGEALKPSTVHFRLNSPAKSDWDYTRPYDPATVIAEIRTGRPVVLHGIGGKPVTHWVLAVDIRGNPPETIIYNDPWVGETRGIPAAASAPEFQGIDGCVVSWMRLMRIK